MNGEPWKQVGDELVIVEAGYYSLWSLYFFFYMLKILHKKKLNRKSKASITLFLFYFTIPIASVPWGPFLGEMKLFYTNSFYKAIHLSPGQRDPCPSLACNGVKFLFSLCFALLFFLRIFFFFLV